MNVLPSHLRVRGYALLTCLLALSLPTVLYFHTKPQEPAEGPLESFNDPQSLFRIRMLSGSEGQLFFEIPTVNGYHYRIFYTDSLLTPDWKMLEEYENIPGTGSLVPVTDSPAGKRFYRIDVQEGAWQ